MRKVLLLSIAITYAFLSFSQDFFSHEIDPKKRYIILTNPTVKNIKTVEFLLSRDLLNLKTKKIKFVGVYYEGQKYDFSKTKEYIEKREDKTFYLHEVKGNLNSENIYRNNPCSEEFNHIFNHSIGTIFFGGADINPALYGEENEYSIVSEPARNYFELSFLFHLLGGTQNEEFTPLLSKRPKYFVTGFCLGLQSMNVATGGTLIQDIPAEIYNATNPEDILDLGRANLHRNYWQNLEDDSLIMTINLHTIQFSDHPFFGKTLKLAKGWQPRVYSSHHQAIEDLGKNLQVTAWSADGKIVEGIAHSKYPNVFAVQFHPEVPALYEDMYERKFHPEDTPMTYHQIIGRTSVRFHKLYWEYVSRLLNSAPKIKKR